ncbi:MAG: hypothetical protein QXU98_06915 [Candidatus Parvarchaeota archaeon]
MQNKLYFSFSIFVFVLLLLSSFLVQVPSSFQAPPATSTSNDVSITIEVIGNGNVTVGVGVVSGGNVRIGVVGPDSSETFNVVTGRYITLSASPGTDSVFNYYSGNFSNSTNSTISFVVYSNGTEVANFGYVPVYVSGATTIHLLLEIVTIVGTFIVILIGFIVGMEFVASSKADEAWERLKSWLIGTILFYAVIIVGPAILGYHL